MRDQTALTRYRFGTRTADFLLCVACGVHVAATCEVDGQLYAVVNVDAVPSLRDVLRQAAPASHDAESVAERLARRKARWSPAQWLELA